MMKKIIRKPSQKSHDPWQQRPPQPSVRPGSRTERPSRPKSGKPGSEHVPGSARNPWSPPKRRANPGARTEPPKARPIPEAEIFPLNKFLAHSGLCARRKAVEFIKSGEVTVNGRIVREPGFKVTGKDKVEYQGKKVSLQHELVYILLNKPKGCITTTDDPQDRHTVMDIIARATPERVYPVGRLDRNTSGLLLLTNDGDLAQQLAHPSHQIKKVYHVTLDKPLTKHDFERIAAGVELEDGVAPVDMLAYEDPEDRKQIGLEIHSGRNRIVRRIFEHLGYDIKALDRVLYAGLTKKNIPRGKWRFLNPREVLLLKHFRKGGKQPVQSERNED